MEIQTAASQINDIPKSSTHDRLMLDPMQDNINKNPLIGNNKIAYQTKKPLRLESKEFFPLNYAKEKLQNPKRWKLTKIEVKKGRKHNAKKNLTSNPITREKLLLKRRKRRRLYYKSQKKKKLIEKCLRARRMLLEGRKVHVKCYRPKLLKLRIRQLHNIRFLLNVEKKWNSWKWKEIIIKADERYFGEFICYPKMYKKRKRVNIEE